MDADESPTDGSDEPSDDGFTRVAAADEIPEGRGIGVSVDGIAIAVFNTGDGFYAISNRCAHQGAPLCKAGEEKINADDTWTRTRGGVDPEEKTVACPWHLWSWDLETGEHEASGKRIGTFDCTVEEGDVFVRI